MELYMRSFILPNFYLDTHCFVETDVVLTPFVSAIIYRYSNRVKAEDERLSQLELDDLEVK